MTDKTTTKPYHDIGGLDLGPVPLSTGSYQLWEKRVDAMLRLLASKAGLIKVDELRRGIETLGEDIYDAEPYYGKWAQSICKIMIEKEVISQAELDQRINEIRTRRGLS